MCVQRTSIRAGLPASSGWLDSISPSSKNETYALNRSCNESSCSSELSHSLGSFITRTASPVFESWAITSITPVRFLLLEISGSMSMSRFDACSRILSELDGRCSTFDFQTRMARRRESRRRNRRCRSAGGEISGRGQRFACIFQVAHASRVLASASRDRELFWTRRTPCKFQLFREDCFGVTPKPACETHALLERRDLNAVRVTN